MQIKAGLAQQGNLEPDLREHVSCTGAGEGFPRSRGAIPEKCVIELELDEEDAVRFYESEKVVRGNVALMKTMIEG